jgi:hypothetical protein
MEIVKDEIEKDENLNLDCLQEINDYIVNSFYKVIFSNKNLNPT